MMKFTIVSSRRATQAEKDAIASNSDARKRNTEKASMGNDWHPLFTILSNHTIWTPVDGKRQCVTCGPVLSGGGQAHLTDAILAAGWRSPEQVETALAAAWTVGVADGRQSGMLRTEPTNPYDGTIYGGRDAARIARTFTTEAKEPETSAHIVQHGDPEPDLLPYKDYRGADGRIWARQVLGGWRWSGECRWSISWEELPPEIFPLTEIIGKQPGAKR